MKKYSFKKSERLYRKKEIESLFHENESFLIFPIKALYKSAENQDDNRVSLLISVPKRNIKKAVHRNLIKRRIKEAYRQNKTSLYEYLEKNNKQIKLVFVYVAKEIIDYSILESKIILTLQRLIPDNEENN